MRIARDLEALVKSMSRATGDAAPLTAEQWAAAAGTFLVVGMVASMGVSVIGAPMAVCAVAGLLAGASASAGRVAARTSRRG